ncbi:hypothetical protein AJ80_03896 [Polytolypa hystricis UAMH7299]|uniref:Glutamine amidotransferase domain-containing protein n=1 Tax=Polytolypa hystricis (strain UAMH7299) TaxID=1447883 RepID=A0A2B7YEE0_POLH7|nr:hypothetical protein AJ80_03896 [Polytolypa hystricis UAMH7299]
MRPPLRIAILECDIPQDNTRAKYGGYSGVFEALLRSSAKALNQPEIVHPDSGLDISKYNVVDDDKYPSLDDIDAILMTGSRHNSYEDIPWINRLVDFTTKVLAQDRVRIIGICFGHQILGRALGVKVGPNEQGWEVAVYDMDLTEEGKTLFGVEKLRLQQMHRDIVHTYPPNTVPLGSTPRCAVQGMYSPRRFIAVQGHPEFNEEIVTEILNKRRYSGVFPDGVYEDGMAKVGNEHDGLIAGKAFLRFLVEG